MSSGTTKFSSPQTWVEAWEMCKEIWKPCNNIKTYHYQQQDHGEEERKTSKHTQPCATSCLIPCENQWCHQPDWLVDQCKYTGGMVALLLSPHPPTQKTTDVQILDFQIPTTLQASNFASLTKKIKIRRIELEVWFELEFCRHTESLQGRRHSSNLPRWG